MVNYAVAQILGKQYKIASGEILSVGFLGDIKSFECDKVLLKVEDQKLQIGVPYLKESLNFEVLGSLGKKIRVATYKSKVNYRRVKGSKRVISQIRLKA